MPDHDQSDDNDDGYALAVYDLVQKGCVLFGGKHPEVVGAALADLVSMLVAGHIAPGDPAETDRVREEVLRIHVEYVRKLLPVNAERIHQRAN